MAWCSTGLVCTSDDHGIEEGPERLIHLGVVRSAKPSEEAALAIDGICIIEHLRTQCGDSAINLHEVNAVDWYARASKGIRRLSDVRNQFGFNLEKFRKELALLAGCTGSIFSCGANSGRPGTPLLGPRVGYREIADIAVERGADVPGILEQSGKPVSPLLTGDIIGCNCHRYPVFLSHGAESTAKCSLLGLGAVDSGQGDPERPGP